MGQRKDYEEKIQHGTAEFPIGLHKLHFTAGTDVIFYVHWHKEFELLVITEGKMIFTIEDREYILKKGDCAFINSDFYHSARAVDGEECGFFAVDFSYHFLNEELNTHFGRKYLQPILNGKITFQEVIYKSDIGSSLNSSWQYQILSYLEEINKCQEDKLYTYELMLKSRIFAIWDLFYQHATANKNQDIVVSAYNERLEPVLSYIHKNYSYEITLLELADIIHMSEGQFCRVFKQSMKVSPVQYLMRYRILKSCHLLLDTDEKISEIANLSGFNNISYYNKVFLQTIGCTPRQYRSNEMRNVYHPTNMGLHSINIVLE